MAFRSLLASSRSWPCPTPQSVVVIVAANTRLAFDVMADADLSAASVTTL